MLSSRLSHLLPYSVVRAAALWGDDHAAFFLDDLVVFRQLGSFAGFPGVLDLVRRTDSLVSGSEWDPIWL